LAIAGARPVTCRVAPAPLSRCGAGGHDHARPRLRGVCRRTARND